MCDEAVVDGEIRMLNHELEVVVGLVELIPKEEVGLRGKSSVSSTNCGSMVATDL